MAKNNKETLLETMDSWYKTIYENYDAAIRPPVLQRAYETVKETVQTAVQKTVSVIQTVWETVKSFFGWLWDKVTRVVKTVVMAVWKTVTTVVEKVVEVTPQSVKDAYQSAKQAFAKAGQAIGDFCMRGVRMVQRGVSSALNAGKRAVSKAAGAMTAALGRALGKAWKWVVKQFNSFKHYIGQKLEKLADWAKQNAPEWMKDAFSKVRRWTSTALSKIGNVLSGIKDWLSPIFARLWQNAPSWLRSLWKRLKEWAQPKLQHLWETLRQVGQDIWTTIKKPIMKLMGLFTYRFRAQADIERFANWGNSEVTSSNLFLLDGVQNQNGVSRQRLRRRSALQQASQTGLMGWIFDWDPSVRLNLQPHQSEGVQQQQDRANQEFLQQHQESSRNWSAGIAWFSFLFSSLMAVLAFFSAGLGLAVLLPFMQAALAGVSLLTMRMQEQVQNDSTLTEQQRQDAQDLFWKVGSPHLFSRRSASLQAPKFWPV